jgi:ABC-type antimicrobial peptide transport system permease subunit
MLSAHPSVASLGAVDALPFSGSVARDGIPQSAGEPVPLVRALPGYFETAGVHLVYGRALLWRDTAEPVAVLSELAAVMLFPGTDPIGQLVRSGRGQSFRVVGVVRDVRMTPSAQPSPLVYGMVDRQFDGRMTIIARLNQRSDSAAIDLRRLLASLDTGMPVITRWWDDEISRLDEYRTPRFQSVVLGTVAALAMGLAVLGIFGVVSYRISGRVREIGIRVALGAAPHSIRRMLLLRSTSPVAVGVSVGLAAIWMSGDVLRSRLYGFQGWDWAAIACGVITITLTALLTTLIPAHRASRLPPTEVLRTS